MKDTDHYAKTGAGLCEVRDRALQLPKRLRTMLIMVDGTRSVLQLRDAARTLGAPEDFLEQLLAQGLVEPGKSRQRGDPAAQSPTASQALGPLPSTAGPGASMAPARDAALEPPAATANERFRVALKFMNDSAVDILGFRAFFFTLKLEKCFTAAELLDLMPEFTAAIAKRSGPEVARALETRARQLLG